MNGNISFDGNSLQTDYIKTEFIRHTDLPEKVATLYAVANANKSAIPAVEYPSKAISVTGALRVTDDILSGNTLPEALDLLIDEFKGYFRGKEKNLDINYAGTTRRYTATVNTLGIDRGVNGKYAKFEIEFICTDPFGRETTATEIADEESYSSATLNMAPTIGGSAPQQLPIFTITLNTITGDGDYIQLSNDSNGQDMLLYGLGFEDGDVVVINCETRQVTVDGTLVDYRGVFLELEPGANSITYTDGFTTRDVDIQAEYYKRYL